MFSSLFGKFFVNLLKHDPRHQQQSNLSSQKQQYFTFINNPFFQISSCTLEFQQAYKRIMNHKYNQLSETTIEISRPSDSELNKRQKQQVNIQIAFPHKQISLIHGSGNAQKVAKEYLLYLSMNLLQQIENNQTRKCSYLLFHIPCILLVCDAIQIQGKQKSQSLDQIFKEELQRLNELSSTLHPQFGKKVIYEIITNALKIESLEEDFFLKQLQVFLVSNKTKMSTFMPYFYYMFELITQRKQYIQVYTSTSQLDNIWREKMSWIRSKFHNFDLQ